MDAVPPPPFFIIPTDVVPTPIVSPERPVAVVHAETVAGGGQKPSGSIGSVSATAGTDDANTTTTITTIALSQRPILMKFSFAGRLGRRIRDEDTDAFQGPNWEVRIINGLAGLPWPES